MKRRTLMKTGIGAIAAGGSGCSHREALPAFLPMSELVQRISRGRLSAVELAKHCLNRIATLDKAGPALNAVIEVNPEARQLALSLDEELSRGVSRGPLHGVLILLKDNIDTRDAMETTAGSLALVGSKPAADAFLVKRLRAAGALILGKTNLSEWANIRSPKSTSGWSARGGLTRHPHFLDHNPSGSSSGSAVAVAAGLVPAAIGTETNGSITSPASACGIVGLKPTLGLISRSGIIPITHWQDTAGPMTRTVRDAAMLLNVLAFVDDQDDETHNASAHLVDYTSLLTTDSLRGVRLGVVRKLSGQHPGVLGLFEKALRKLREAGAIIIDPVELPHADELGQLSMFALLTELRSDLNAYLTKRGGIVRTLADVIVFNEKHREQEMPYFGQEFFEQAEKLNTPEMLKAGAEARQKAHRLARAEGIDAALQANQLDALICPTNDPTGKTDLGHGDKNVRCACTPAAVAGYPHLTVPMGFVDQLPIGLSFIGPAWSEAKLLGFGHAFEHVMPAFSAPKFIPARS
jgi:amidase